MTIVAATLDELNAESIMWNSNKTPIFHHPIIHWIARLKLQNKWMEQFLCLMQMIRFGILIILGKHQG